MQRAAFRGAENLTFGMVANPPSGLSLFAGYGDASVSVLSLRAKALGEAQWHQLVIAGMTMFFGLLP